jgi:glycosyltransferase involved in cell wall biosynthesis
VKGRIVLAYNTSWYVWNFRMPLIAALRGRGCELIVLAPRDEYTDRIVASGVAHRDIKLAAKGRNPLRELATIGAFARAYRQLKPDLVLQYTIKPNIYGSIAARCLGIPAINNVTGLGQAFERRGALQAAVRLLYRFAFRKVDKLFFQNPDDLGLFVRGGLAARERCGLLPGSGVDLERFRPASLPAVGGRAEGPCTFLFVGRLLEAKGVGVLLEAAALVKAKRPDAVVRLLGKRDDADPGAVDPRALDAAIAAGLVEHAGMSDDVRPQLAACDCVVLPSYYREGTPRSLLEAAAMGKPLVAADTVGTREPVVDGKNGFLCRPKDPADLAAKMLAMIDASPERRRAMGAASRALAETRFDEKIVLKAYVETVERILRSGKEE